MVRSAPYAVEPQNPAHVYHHTELVTHLVDQVARDQHHVVTALAQGREAHLHHVEAVVEVIPELPLLDRRLEVDVCRRDDANIHRLALCRADLGDRALLQNTQQLDLEVERHLADFIEEDRAAVCGLELPLTRR